MALCMSCYVWVVITYEEDHANPLVSYCLPCVLLYNLWVDEDCIDTCFHTIRSPIFWWCCCLCSLIPMIIWILFLPFYLLTLMIVIAKENNHDDPFFGIFGCYLFPHTILQIVALLIMNTRSDDYVILNLLLIIAIILSVLW